ncbi:glycosyl transferase group 1 [Hymenobacter roseosalivarius DSM 11622]|uniref:Glycosyl transferase group 1 n=1 Tax=Hymenobacter roseosalivarius DSM 11622 TaxID=645990 RepID=A0A1W1VH42_9BACT|nr:glycosyltransferase family 4 protein [Hymenobacter roseosalivarius]SMB92697.1 glycosyl transferase group 1 [Hymenobacter roseosalivarius DSM 11622]
MRILLLHNRYQQAGGEDVVFRAELELLRTHGHATDTLEFDNDHIQSAWDKLLTGLRSLYNPSSARLLKKKIEAYQPDIIHIHNFFPVGSPSLLYAAAAAGVPVVMTLHNYRLVCPSAILYTAGQIYERSVNKILPWDAIRRGVYRNSRAQTASVAVMTGVHKILGTWRDKVDRYLVLTDFARNIIVNSSLKLRPEQVVIKVNSVPDCGIGPVQRQEQLLFIGRLTPEKGIEVLLSAAEKGKLPLHIIGDGPLRSEVEECAARCPSIIYTGFSTREIVAAALQHARALIVASTWYEGMPLVVLEAFAAGTPVIASRLGGLGELIQHEVNGLHFEPGNADDLIAQAKRLCGDSELAVKLGQSARKSYDTRYSPERNYQQLVAIYQSVLTDRTATNELEKALH